MPTVQAVKNYCVGMCSSFQEVTTDKIKVSSEQLDKIFGNIRGFTGVVFCSHAITQFVNELVNEHLNEYAKIAGLILIKNKNWQRSIAFRQPLPVADQYKSVVWSNSYSNYPDSSQARKRDLLKGGMPNISLDFEQDNSENESLLSAIDKSLSSLERGVPSISLDFEQDNSEKESFSSEAYKFFTSLHSKKYPWILSSDYLGSSQARMRPDLLKPSISLDFEQDNQGLTAPNHAIEAKNIGAVEPLLEAEADGDTREEPSAKDVVFYKRDPINGASEKWSFFGLIALLKESLLAVLRGVLNLFTK